MPVRTFDGVDDWIQLALGSLGFAFGPGSIGMILRKPNDASVTHTPLWVGTSTLNARYGFQIATTTPRLRTNASDLSAAPTGRILAADGWVLVVATKASGTAAVRFHFYKFAAGTWLREDGTSIPNSGAPANAASLGAFRTGTTPSVSAFFAGDLGIVGVWNRVLTDSEVSTLVQSQQAWTDSTPVALWPLDQASTSTAVEDTIGAADQTSLTGTSVTNESIPWTGSGVTVSPTAIASGQAFGTPVVISPRTIAPNAIASAEEVPSPRLSGFIAPAGIASAQVVPAPVVVAPHMIRPSGIPSLEAQGIATIGTPTVKKTLTIKLPNRGIRSSEAVGTPKLTGAIVTAPSISSAEAFGLPTIVMPLFVSPASIQSSEAFGQPRIALPGAIVPVSISSQEAFGQPVIASEQTVQPEAISSGEAFGTPTLITLPLTVSPVGISSAQIIGTPTVFVSPPPPIIGPPVGSDEPGAGFGLVLPGTSGFVGPTTAARPGFFRIKLTNLYRPAAPDGSLAERYSATLAVLEQFVDAQVEIPFNDQRSAQVTISMHDPACLHVFPYRTMLHVVYVTPTAAHLVFWGPLVQPAWDSENETVTLHALDPSVRLQHHYIRYGDAILNTPDDPTLPNPYGRGFIPFDHNGLMMLRDCGNVGAPIPSLGIADGNFSSTAYDQDTSFKGKYERGAEVWATWLEIVGHQAAPDFELEPIDNVQGVYCRINTFDRQGNTDPLGLILHDGFGKDNARIDYSPGGKLITHAHVLNQGDKNRVTVGDWRSARDHGAYVYWDSTEYKGSSDDPLILRGKQLVAAYGTPPDYFTATLNPDADLYFKDDFYTGDNMTVAIRRGLLERAMQGRLVKTVLRQIDSSGNVVPEIESIVHVGEPVEGIVD